MCKSFYRVLFSAVVLVLTLSFASTVAAQEEMTAEESTAEESTAEATTSEESTMMAADAANPQVEAQTDDVSVQREGEKVSVKTSDVSTSNEASSQQTPVRVQQDQADEGSGSEASTGNVTTDQTSGIPAGKAATGSNPDNPSSPPNLITIRISDCTVSDGASITVEDIDGTEALFRDNERGIEITETSNEIRIEGPPDSFIGNHAELLDPSDRSFDTDGDYAVVTSTGITCRGDNNDGNRDNNRNNNRNNRNNRNNDNNRNNRIVVIDDGNRDGNRVVAVDGAARRQYGDEKVIVETIPDKGKLSDTGGVPLAGVAFIALVSVGLGLSVVRSASRRDP